MRLQKRLLSLALAVLLVFSGALLSPTLQVAAQTSSDLYGTGSADEINIVKLLDMALNKGGMSMSPATIKAFLEYWWSSVNSDLSTCISNADSAITTTQAFADYVISALENADHYDKLGSITQQYVRFVLTLDAKSVSDFKQLLTQQGTFRRFLLSYVTDQDGNIAGTVDNKIKKYNLKSGFVNMARKAVEAYIEEYEGYYLVPTFTYKDISPTMFSSKDYYETLLAMLKKIPDGSLFSFYLNKQNVYDLDFPNLNFVINSYAHIENGSFDVYLYDSDWKLISSLDSSAVNADGLENFPLMSGKSSLYASRFSFNTKMITGPTDSNILLFSKDGLSIRVWKSLDSFKAYSVGQSNIYYTNTYSSFDSNVDNSIEFSGSYYNSTNTTYSHDVIQNTIDNSSEVNESTVNNIVNNYITNNNYGDSSGGSGSGSSSGSGDWWNIGSGLESFIKGIAALLDFALKLLGDLIALLSTFATSVLDLFKSLALIGSEFGDFLAEVFPFLPPECINIIIGSIGGMCIVGVVNIFKK